MERTLKVAGAGLLLLAGTIGVAGAADASVGGYSGPKDELHVYLLIGGSAMSGEAETGGSETEGIGRCYLLNAEGKWEPAKGALNRYSAIRNVNGVQRPGPVRSFAKTMLEANKDVSIGLVVNAGDGSDALVEHYGDNRMFDDPANMRLFAACEQVGLPVHFHIDANKNMDERGLPRLERVLKQFPTCNFIAHAEFWLELSNGTCDRLLQIYPNLYAEPSGHRMAMELNRDRAYTRKFLIRNADKILFGTDEGWWSFGKTERAIQFALFEALDLPVDVKAKIYHQNAARLFWHGNADERRPHN